MNRNLKTIHFLKNNAFLVFVLCSYLFLGLFLPSISWQGIKNSGYYLKEMLMIMPVIFVLTALLDSFIPKETIVRFLGKDAKFKGIFLSFLLGSVSAGPIYAAFPFCVMLHKKGATIKNIVIILSSWAVIKIPMLLNEAKFLGLRFMAFRYVLTVVAILIFSHIADRLIRDEDISQAYDIPANLEMDSNSDRPVIQINKTACMGCSICTRNYPELFQMEGKKASQKEFLHIDIEKLKETVTACPVNAISIGSRK